MAILGTLGVFAAIGLCVFLGESLFGPIAEPAP